MNISSISYERILIYNVNTLGLMASIQILEYDIESSSPVRESLT